MIWKPTEEQLQRAREQIAAEKGHKPLKQKHKPKRSKRNRKPKPAKKKSKAPDYVSMQFWQRFGPGGQE